MGFKQIYLKLYNYFFQTSSNKTKKGLEFFFKFILKKILWPPVQSNRVLQRSAWPLLEQNGEIPQLILFNIVGVNIFSGKGRGGVYVISIYSYQYRKPYHLVKYLH